MQQLTPNTLLQGGTYRIEKVLGQGGFGITYLAEQVMLGRKVAIKEFFMKDLCERDEITSHVTLGTEGSRNTVSRFREKFQKEASNIAKLNHPNIVRVIGVFEENGTAYYVMEFAENGSLADKIKKDGYLSEPVATRYILQVAEALNYIHQRKMNHLDIKPANIMLNEKDEIVLIDFGLSKQYDVTTGNQTSTTPIGISEGYAPMEQYTGSIEEFSPETDIYALGATFFKLLTGATPPKASDINEDGVPIDELNAKGVSQTAIDVICKTMEGRKKDRMKDVSTFIEYLHGRKHSSCEPTANNINSEETILVSDSTISSGPTYTAHNHNFSYPLTININKKIHTDCQSWTIHSLELQKNKSILKMTVQSLDEATTAWSGTGRITTNEGKVLKQTSTNLPRRLDNSFIIDSWNTYSVEDVYPAIDRDSSGFSIVNQSIIIPNIEINNGRCYVPDANTEDFQGITREELANKRNRNNDTNSSSTGCGLWIVIGIIALIALAIQ